MATLTPKLRSYFTDEMSDCTPNFTGRAWVFLKIYDWLSNPNGSRYFLLTGEPGSGKTAIAQRLTQFSQSQESLHPDLLPSFLNAIHICSARDSTSVDPRNFCKSVALQLAEIQDYAIALANIDTKHVNIQATQNLGTVTDSTIQNVVINNLDVSGVMTAQEAFNLLVLNPLQYIYQNGFNQPITILVDALDEALTHEGKPTIVDLLSKLENLPAQIRFILTSRKEARIENKFLDTQELYLSDSEFNQLNQHDVREYIEKRFVQDEPLSVLVADLKPQQRKELIEQIAEKSEGNFLYVSFLLNAITKGQRSLYDLEGLPEGLDGLYYQSLERVVELGKQDWHETYAPFMGILSVARTSLTLSQLQAFTQQSESRVWKCLTHLRQFLEEVEPTTEDEENQYRLYHQSVVDFLRKRSLRINQKKRHNLYYLSAKEWHQLIVDYYIVDNQPWHSRAIDDYYLWNYLPYHLLGAEQVNRLRKLLFDFDWLQAKLDATDPNALIGDYDFLPNDIDLQLVQGAARLAAHILAQDKTQFAGQLLGRLLSFNRPEIQPLLEQAKQWRTAPWLRPLVSNLTQPSGALLRIFSGHSDYVSALAMLSNKGVISASGDCTLKLWDLGRGECQHTFSGHSNWVTGVVVTPDSNYAISAARDFTLRLWNLNSGECQHILINPCGLPTAIAVTPDSSHVIFALNDCTLKYWNLSTGECQRILEILEDYGQVTAIAVIPGTNHVIVAFANFTLQLWDLSTSECQLTLEGHRGWISTVVVTPDGKQAVSASHDKTLKLWDLSTGKCQFTFEEHHGSVSSVALTSDSNHVISASYDKTLKLWNLSTGMCLGTFKGHRDWVNAVVVTPDGKQAVSASDDKTLKLWNLSHEQCQFTFETHRDWVNAVVVTLDGKQAVSASRDHTIKLWDLSNGKCRGTLQGHSSSVSAVAVTPDSNYIISASVDKTLKLWNLSTGECQRTLQGHSSPVSAVVVTPDGNHIISASYDKTLKLWNLNTGECKCSLQGHSSPISAVVVTPDGNHIISASADKTLKLWNLSTGECQRTLQAHSGSVNTVVVTPDGNHVISTSADETLKLWDLSIGDFQLAFERHYGWVNSLAGTPDGALVILASADKALKLWNLESDTLIASFSGESQFLSCAVAPNGLTIVAGDQSGQLHFWQLEGLR
jgi:WD40 repeat protein